MSNETEFVGGLIAKAPHPKSPEYVKAKLSIKRQELIDWLSGRDDEWINAEVKESRNGKWYAAVDPWKPEKEGGQRRQRSERPADPPANGGGTEDDIPFAQYQRRTIA